MSDTQNVDWQHAALRVGEDLADVGPNGYYEFGPEQWRTWCLTSIATLRAALETAEKNNADLREQLAASTKLANIYTVAHGEAVTALETAEKRVSDLLSGVDEANARWLKCKKGRDEARADAEKFKQSIRALVSAWRSNDASVIEVFQHMDKLLDVREVPKEP